MALALQFYVYALNQTTPGKYCLASYPIGQFNVHNKPDEFIGDKSFFS